MEAERERIITNISVKLINDVHKTDIHRFRAIINEYKEDLKDPNIPKAVKKQIEEDLKEAETLLDAYINDKDMLETNMNKIINEALEEKDERYEKQQEKEAKKADTDNKPEEDKK
jgi:hypothetical protein